VAEGEGFEPPRASRPGGFQVVAGDGVGRIALTCCVAITAA
jgi:hypothetical protein